MLKVAKCACDDGGKQTDQNPAGGEAGWKRKLLPSRSQPSEGKEKTRRLFGGRLPSEGVRKGLRTNNVH